MNGLGLPWILRHRTRARGRPGFWSCSHPCGVDLRDYVQNGELLARCQIKALERYDYDAVFALMDVGVETEAVGSD